MMETGDKIVRIVEEFLLEIQNVGVDYFIRTFDRVQTPLFIRISPSGVHVSDVSAFHPYYSVKFSRDEDLEKFDQLINFMKDAIDVYRM